METSVWVDERVVNLGPRNGGGGVFGWTVTHDAGVVRLLSKVQHGRTRGGEGESVCGIFLVSELHWHKACLNEDFMSVYAILNLQFLKKKKQPNIIKG